MSDPTPAADFPNKAPMRFRRTRIAVSVFFGLLTVALCVLWVRSCLRSDSLHACVLTHAVEAWNEAGEIHWALGDCNGGIRWIHYSKLLNPEHDAFIFYRNEGRSKYLLGFGIAYAMHGPLYAVPHWFLVLCSAAIAAAPWQNRPAAQFSLRTLLIATTLIAVVLGLGVWLVS